MNTPRRFYLSWRDIHTADQERALQHRRLLILAALIAAALVAVLMGQRHGRHFSLARAGR